MKDNSDVLEYQDHHLHRHQFYKNIRRIVQMVRIVSYRKGTSHQEPRQGLKILLKIRK